MSTDSLPILLRALTLTTIAREQEGAREKAEAENWGYRRYLHYLIEAETNERLRRRIERQLKDSGLPPGKTLGTLEETKLPDKVRRQLPTLIDGDFTRINDPSPTSKMLGRRYKLSRCRPRNPHAQNSSSAVAFLPVVGVSMQVLHRPDNDNLVLNRTIDAVGKAADKIASAILFDDSPSVRRSNDRLHRDFDFVNELVAQTRHLPIVILTRSDELSECCFSVTVGH
jgi:hypothetical protein